MQKNEEIWPLCLCHRFPLSFWKGSGLARRQLLQQIEWTSRLRANAWCLPKRPKKDTNISKLIISFLLSVTNNAWKIAIKRSGLYAWIFFMQAFFRYCTSSVQNPMIFHIFINCILLGKPVFRRGVSGFMRLIRPKQHRCTAVLRDNAVVSFRLSTAGQGTMHDLNAWLLVFLSTGRLDRRVLVSSLMCDLFFKIIVVLGRQVRVNIISVYNSRILGENRVCAYWCSCKFGIYGRQQVNVVSGDI